MTERDDHARTRADFKAAVNMTAKAIEDWLKTEESRTVGQTAPGESESTGHHFGRHIVEILRKKQSELSDEDYAHMTKVVRYVHRHLKQRPHGDITETRWRYSLMNWGHDPA